MDEHAKLASIRVNGEQRGNDSSADTRAFGRAERLANVGQLAAGLAHEMNTPLGSISAHAEESLEMLEQLPCARLTREKVDELRERLLAIMRQAHRCSRIATRLLQFAQPGRSLGVKSRVEQVVSDVTELFSPAAQELGVNLTRQLSKELHDAPVAPADLEQLLVNLLQNSLDACRRGDSISIESSVRDSRLLLVVSDSGCGIPQQTLNRIFDPFFTTKPVGHGTGLGLSVCHGIARGVGGSIEVVSAPGQGTRVTVSLPLDASVGSSIRVQDAGTTEAVRGKSAECTD